MAHSRLLFGSVVFLASFLLFPCRAHRRQAVAPMLGGSAAVWIACLVFFQTALLCAYPLCALACAASALDRRIWFLRLAIGLCRFLGIWRHRSEQRPRTSRFHNLSCARPLDRTSLPRALGATSPLLQVWWSRVEQSQIPYRLFALSNLASLLALAAYPTLVEPNLTLHAQRIDMVLRIRCSLPCLPRRSRAHALCRRAGLDFRSGGRGAAAIAAAP